MGAVRYLSYGTRSRLLCHIRWAQAQRPGVHTRVLDVLPPSISVLSLCTTATAPGPPLRCSPWASTVLHAAVVDAICFYSSVPHPVPTLLPRYTHTHTHNAFAAVAFASRGCSLSSSLTSFCSYLTILSLLTSAVCVCVHGCRCTLPTLWFVSAVVRVYVFSLCAPFPLSSLLRPSSPSSLLRRGHSPTAVEHSSIRDSTTPTQQNREGGPCCHVLPPFQKRHAR